MKSKIFLNIKDLVEDLIENQIGTLSFLSAPPAQDHILIPSDIDPSFVRYLTRFYNCLGISTLDQAFYLINFAFSEQHYLEYQQILNLLQIGEIDLVQKIIQDVQNIRRQSVNDLKFLELNSLLVRKNLQREVDHTKYPKIIECYDYEQFKEILIGTSATDLEYCSELRRSTTTDDIWDFNIAIGIRSKSSNTLWTVRGDNLNGEMSEAYSVVLGKNQEFLDKISTTRSIRQITKISELATHLVDKDELIRKEAERMMDCLEYMIVER